MSSSPMSDALAIVPEQAGVLSARGSIAVMLGSSLVLWAGIATLALHFL